MPHWGSKKPPERPLTSPTRSLQPKYQSTPNISVSHQHARSISWDPNQRPTGHTPWGLHGQQTRHTPWKLHHAPARHIPCEVDLLSGSDKKAQQRRKNAEASKKVRDRKRQEAKLAKYHEECLEVQGKKIECLLKLLGFDSEEKFLFNTPSVTDWPSGPGTPPHVPASESPSAATSPTLSTI